MTPSKNLLWGAVVGCAIGGMTILWPARALSDTPSINVPIETVVDYIHAVIAADREVYTRHAVQRMQKKGVAAVSERWDEKNTLPLPAQFLSESGRQVGKMGLGVQYRLISFWPINKDNVPSNALESIGLGVVSTDPDRPHKGVTKVGDTRYFEAVYADLAVAPRCAGCHNAHPDSPKRDFKLNDVMGAIVVSVQLDQEQLGGFDQP